MKITTNMTEQTMGIFTKAIIADNQVATSFIKVRIYEDVTVGSWMAITAIMQAGAGTVENAITVLDRKEVDYMRKGLDFDDPDYLSKMARTYAGMIA